MDEIAVQTCNGSNRTQSFRFGGEIQTQIPGLRSGIEGNTTVSARIQSAESVMQLCLVDEILNRNHGFGARTLLGLAHGRFR